MGKALGTPGYLPLEAGLVEGTLALSAAVRRVWVGPSSLVVSSTPTLRQIRGLSAVLAPLFEPALCFCLFNFSEPVQLPHDLLPPQFLAPRDGDRPLDLLHR